MTEFTNGVVSGIVSTIVAAPLLYLIRYNLSFLVNIFFSFLYPDVTGEYRCYTYSIGERAKNPKNNKQESKNDRELLKSNMKLLSFLKKLHSKDDSHTVMILKQFANRVKGELRTIKEDEVRVVEKINGKVTASRILVLNYETIDKEHYNLGSYLLQLTNTNSLIRGTGSGLCFNCGEAASAYILLEKKK